ncbi:MAG: DUF4340 domain-containing protein [Opitutaceae bacterium]|nr:DUF4340 domain-containing protein [Opitutaceae bacterium]
MRTKVTLALLFLNVVLFWAIFYLREDTAVGADPNLVLGPTASALKSLTIEAQGSAIVLEQTDEQWILTKPIEWTANDFAVRAILGEINGLRAETTFAVSELAASGQTLADYGLDKPALTLTLQPSAAGAPAQRLAIGNATQGGNRLYILSPDETRIHVVSRNLAERLGMSVGELRSDVLFNIPVFEAQTLTIEGAPGQRTLLRRDGERWNIETLQARANRVDTELCLGALGALRLDRFAEAPADSVPTDAFSQPELRVTVEGNRRRETLLLSRPWASGSPGTGATAYLARMEDDPARNGTPFIVSLPDTLIHTLKHAQRDLREKRLLEFDAGTVSSISLRSLDAELLLQRLDSSSGPSAESQWQVVERKGDTGPTPVAADTGRVEALLRDLSRVSADEFTNDAPSAADRENYGLVRPVRTIVLTLAPVGSAPAQILTLLVGNGVEHRTYASLAEREAVYRIPDDFLQAVPVAAHEYRSRVVREVAGGATITNLRLHNLATNTLLLDSDVEDATEKAAVETLAARVRLLKAKAFLPAAPSEAGVSFNGREFPWVYRLDASVALPGATEPQLLAVFFTERIGGTSWIAWTGGQAPAFLIEQELADALFALTYGRQDPGPPQTSPAPTS